jgi:hypothetical protein
VKQKKMITSKQTRDRTSNLEWHAMGEVQELPRWLAKTNKRFKIPHYALIFLTIVGVVLVFLVPLRQLMPVASAGTLVWYAATNFAALKINKEQRFVWPIISWLGIAACLGRLLADGTSAKVLNRLNDSGECQYCGPRGNLACLCHRCGPSQRQLLQTAPMP